MPRLKQQAIGAGPHQPELPGAAVYAGGRTGEVVWQFSDDSLARVSGNHTHQRRLKALQAGYLEVWVTQEGVQSNTIGLTFGP